MLDVLTPIAIYLAVGAVFYIGLKGRFGSQVLDVVASVLWPLTLVWIIVSDLFGGEG